MVDFNKLTKAEQLDIISFGSSKGVMYYSRVEELTLTTLVYNGKTIKIDHATYDYLKEGMDTYELYKLTMTRSDAAQLIVEEAQQQIEEFYVDKFQTALDTFKTFSESTREVITDAADYMKTTGKTTDDYIKDIKAFRETLANNVEEIEITEISNEFKERMSDVKSVKDEFTRDLRPIKEDLHGLINSLRQIVTSDK